MRRTLSMISGWLVLGSACGDVRPIAVDAAGDAEVVLDAGGPCNLAAPFSTPVPVPGVNGALTDWCPRLSPNHLDIYLTREDVAGGNFDLVRYSRTSTTSVFGNAVVLSAVNSTSPDECAYVTADGLQLYFDSRRTGNYDLYLATRASLVAEFANPTPLTNVNTTENEWWLWPNGNELYFTATRASVTSLFRSLLAPNGSYGLGSQVAELHAPGSTELGASLTADGTTIYFTRVTTNNSDIWTSTRPSSSAPFAPPRKVDEVSSAAADDHGWVSDDGCEIYFSSSRDGTYDIFRARKPPA